MSSGRLTRVYQSPMARPTGSSEPPDAAPSASLMRPDVAMGIERKKASPESQAGSRTTQPVYLRPAARFAFSYIRAVVFHFELKRGGCQLDDLSPSRLRSHIISNGKHGERMSWQRATGLRSSMFLTLTDTRLTLPRMPSRSENSAAAFWREAGSRRAGRPDPVAGGGGRIPDLCRCLGMLPLPGIREGDGSAGREIGHGPHRRRGLRRPSAIGREELRSPVGQRREAPYASASSAARAQARI
jgi:hypothetical protein